MIFDGKFRSTGMVSGPPPAGGLLPGQALSVQAAASTARAFTARVRRGALRASPASLLAPYFTPGAKLHVGCGPKKLAGWLNTDAAPGVGPDGVVDLHNLKLPAETFAVIYGCHVLEHCWTEDTLAILVGLRRALRPGGTLRLSVPDLRLVVRNCIDSHVYGDERSALSVLYGGSFSRATGSLDLHRQAFWRERLEQLMVKAGLVNVREWGPGQYPEIDAARDYATWPRGPDGRSAISLNLEADRPLGSSHVSTAVAAARSSAGSKVVSVLMAVGPVSRWLEEAAWSVLEQSLPNGWRVELLVGVDGCQGSLDVAVRIRDPRVAIFTSKVPLGTYVMANALLAHAHGELVGRCDADDVTRPGRLRAIVEAAEAGAAAVNTHFSLADANLHEIRVCGYPVDGAWFFKTSLMAMLGGWQPWPCGADSEILSRVRALKAKIGVVPRDLYIYRRHGSQLTEGSGTGADSLVRAKARRAIAEAERRFSAGEVPAPLRVNAAPVSRVAVPVPAAGHVVDVSVLLGTVGRSEMLRACVDSVRASLSGAGFSYEVVVAYGGEDDPSLPWMWEQPDLVLVAGGVGGAIPAFNKAYTASHGRYVCQLNDDLLVVGDAIPRALRHMEADYDCAGVVFKSDRGDGAGLRHIRFKGGELHPNQVVARRETCEAVVERIGAFWGDAAHRTHKTYGGDSAFGVVCHHLGLRLDSVDGVECLDRRDEADDSLRAGNQVGRASHEVAWNAAYLPLLASRHVAGSAEWPRLYVPRPGAPPRRSPVAAGPPLRVFHLAIPLDRPNALEQALAKVGSYAFADWSGREREAIAAARAHQPDVVWAQVQSGAWTPSHTAALRAAVGPKCTMCLWSGDVRTPASKPVERWLVEQAGVFDVVLTSNCAYPRKLVLDEKVKAACGYLGCGVDPALHYQNLKAVETSTAVFFGTNYRGLDGGAREQLFSIVERAMPGVLAVYGDHWEGSAVAPRSHPAQHPRDSNLLMWSAAVTVSTSLFHDLPRYSSDRLKRAAAAGAVVAVREFPDMAGLGFVDGVNCLVWRTADDLVGLLRRWTRPEQAPARRKIRAAVAALASERFTWDRVVEELLAILRDHRARRG